MAIQIGYALGIGLLIGLERSFGFVAEEQGDVGGEDQIPPSKAEPELAEAEEDASEDSSKDEAKTPEEEPPELKPPDSKPAGGIRYALAEQMGVRTITILSLTGYAVAVIGETLPIVPPVALGILGLLVIAMYFRASAMGVGITTEAAAFSAAALGMLCRYHHDIAAIIAVVVTAALASKHWTHSTIRKMRRVELTDTLKFLVVVLIVLPLLPNRALDPYGAFNPYKVGVLVVLISGIGFAGYFLTRILGAQKGLGLTGVVGGLTSSTAVTAAMAAQAKEAPQLRAICAFATVAANATMFARVLVVVAVLDFPLFQRLAWSVGGMGVTAVAATGVLWFVSAKSQKDSGASHEIALKNPFSVGPALKFAAFFVFILFALRLSQKYLGDQGLYAAALLSGLADVDAITLSISEQAHAGEMVRKVGAIAITIAVVSNSATKTGIAIYSGGWGFGKLVGLCLGAATVVGLAAAFIV
ncbi:MAG: DUF4010 domain-containing protein [Deltaproteobacteria bacterium]|nr:DUF4010 domain-containing protein [Deltaproteobacteria bacterium]